ncbi:MAG: type II secretion system F family protein [Phycisphaeraceae bacterium]|nr:type II secretion system F family protein [Phycisphaeraceae bacterium]
MSTQLSFEYTAIDKRGAKCRGVAKAATEVDAYRQVTAAGLTPVKIKQMAAKRMGKRRSVRAKDVAHFTYQLSVLISARVPIGESLRGIAEQEPPGKFRDVVFDIAKRIEAGGRIADAMEEHVGVFGALYVSTVRAAEQSGNMVKVLEYLSEMLERNIEMKQAVRSALMYPICVVSVLCIACFFLVGFVIPKFAKMFAQKGVDLPIFTKIMMAIGISIQNYWYLYLAVLVGGAFAIRTAYKRPKGRWAIEAALHRIPYLREILIGLAVARFSRVFGLCLNSGLGLIDSLHMAGKASARPMLEKDAERLVDQVRTGGRISVALIACEYITPFAKRMLTSGEESAELTRMCSIIARQYERDTATLTKNIATVIEPVLIVLIAAVVLVVALAIFLPMWDMVKLLS